MKGYDIDTSKLELATAHRRAAHELDDQAAALRRRAGNRRRQATALETAVRRRRAAYAATAPGTAGARMREASAAYRRKCAELAEKGS